MTPLKTMSAAAALVVGTLALGACSPSSTGHDMSGMATPSAGAATTSASSAASASGTSAAEPHNDADVMFATMMLPHHQQAVELSGILLSKAGIDVQVRDLATKIKAAQAPEIAQMSGWLAGWGADPSPTGMGNMPGMSQGSGDGMMSQADMDAFKNADGRQAPKMFLTGMIAHHQGAVAMAQTELTQGQNTQAKKLARSILGTQNAQITQMKQLLGT